jgi:hypothetical protein
MRAWYRLLDYEFRSMIHAAGLLSLGVIVTPLVLVRLEMKHYSAFSQQRRFEDLYADSGSILVFGIYFAALFAVFLAKVYGHYWGSKSIYTLLALPVRREAIYFGKLGAFAVCALLLWAAELLAVWWCYEYVAGRQAAAAEGRFVMENGLFLAFIRSEFLRLILPQSLIGWLSTSSLLLVNLTGVFYGALCERSKRYWGFIPAVIAAWWMIRTTLDRLDDPASAPTTAGLVTDSLVLLAFSAFFIWHSLRLIKKGAIA